MSSRCSLKKLVVRMWICESADEHTHRPIIISRPNPYRNFNSDLEDTMTNRSSHSRLIPLTFSLLLVTLACVTAFGQGGTSTINGTVVDPQGNVVPGATATLSNASKNFSRSQTTTDGGHFNFALIPPGEYQLIVEAKGFKKAVVKEVNALI